MQLRFPFLSAGEHAEHAEPAPAADRAEYVVKAPVIHFVRMRRARRYVMRVRPDGDLRVTIPRGGSKAEALRFAERHRDWAERQRTRVMEGRRPAAVDRELRAGAAAELPPQLLALAATHGLTVESGHDPRSALALGLVLVTRAHHPQLPVDADAAGGARGTS